MDANPLADALEKRIEREARVQLAQLPTPLHRIDNFGSALGIANLWIKRDDLTGLEGGGNKTRKLEFLVGEAVANGCDMLVTAGAVQSNHTRQTAAAAAKSGLKCALLHLSWTTHGGPYYQRSGNILLSSLMGADLYIDAKLRPIEDQSPLQDFAQRLEKKGYRPYVIPGGASEHPLGSLGYAACAAEILRQFWARNTEPDYIVHCTGSSSTQAGLLAGLKLMRNATRVIGIADDNETDIKQRRVLSLANATLARLGCSLRVTPDEVVVIAADMSCYGTAEPETFELIRLLARSEGLVADPVYEGKALRGLSELANGGRFAKDATVLLMHLGGTPAVHGYAEQFGAPRLLQY